MKKLVLVACVLAGCANTNEPHKGKDLRPEFEHERTGAGLAASKADAAAGRTGVVTAASTMAYWLRLKAALRPRPIDPAEVARTVTLLPTLGADPELVREGQVVAEKMRAAGTAIRSLSGFALVLPLSGTAKAENLARDAVEQCHAVERMRPDLAARYGVEFPSLDLPAP